MTVEELIAKLQAIDDKTMHIVFYCPSCEQYIPIYTMKEFGFHKQKGK